MKWFEGSVIEGIAEARKLNALFVVFVTKQENNDDAKATSSDDDDTSALMSSLLEEEEVSEEFLRNKCVCVRLDSGSLLFTQFSQIYPVLCIPSLYVIGSDGLPLEVVVWSEGMKGEDVVKKVSGARERDGEVAGSSSRESEDSAQSMEERVEKAQQLIEKKRRDKEAEEKEKVRKQELERRETGKNVQKFKQQQKVDELKKAASERAKEKAEDKEAREKIKRQIEEDRVERAKKYEASKIEENNVRKEMEMRKRKEEDEKEGKRRAEAASKARLQVRLPDGSSITNTFDASDTLSVVRDWIVSATNITSPFILATTYPRQEYQDGDMSNTLRELHLAPSAVLILLPRRGASTRVGDEATSSSSWLALILRPFLLVWGLITSLLFGKRDGITAPRSDGGLSDDDGLPPVKRSDRPRTAYGSRGAGRGEGGVYQQQSFRQEGNITRMINDDDEDDDDNATWNGNSTQQM